MNKRYRYIFLTFSMKILSLITVGSQAKDFHGSAPGIQSQPKAVHDLSAWGLINARYGVIPKKLTLSLIGEFRSYTNLTTFDMAHSILGIDYHVCKYFTIGASYHVFGLRNATTDNFFLMHGPEVSAMGTYTHGNFNFMLLERVDFFFIPDGNGGCQQDFQIRNLAQVKYHIPGTIASPLIGIEPFVQLKDTQKWKAGSLIEVRYMIGSDFRLDKHNTISLKGMLVNKGMIRPDLFRYVVEIDYIITF